MKGNFVSIALIVIGIIGFAFYLQLQTRQKKLRMKQGNYFLLLNALFAVWGIISAISYLVEMILFFEFVYLLDFLTLVGALVVSVVSFALSLLAAALSAVAIVVGVLVFAIATAQQAVESAGLGADFDGSQGLFPEGVVGVQSMPDVRARFVSSLGEELAEKISASPVSGESVTPFQPNSGVVVLPRSRAPCSRRRATTAATARDLRATSNHLHVASNLTSGCARG